MFKSKEELLTKEDEFFDDLDSGYNTGILVAFKSFVERVEFYKKYYRVQTALKEQHPKIYKKYKQIKETKTTIAYIRYEDWLFDFCFKDVE